MHLIGCTSEAIEEKTNMNQWGVFEAALDLVREGHAVCVQHLEGTWLNLTKSDADVSYRLAKISQDLDQMRDMVGEQLALLCRIKGGIDKAEECFTLAKTKSRLNGT
jgi:hypothetical protein